MERTLIKKYVPYLKIAYTQLDSLYADTTKPFEKITDELYIKTFYDYDRQAFMIIFRNIEDERVDINLKMPIGNLVNFFQKPDRRLFNYKNIEKTKDPTIHHKVSEEATDYFLVIMEKLKNDIQKVFENKNIIQRFEVYGHSRAGVLAFITHGWLKQNYGIHTKYFDQPRVTTITTGCPRVIFEIPFNPFQFFNYFRLKLVYKGFYRFVNVNDVVTRLPFKWLFYNHVNKDIKLEKPFSFRKLFKPAVYHDRERYNKLIIEYLENLALNS